MLLEATRLKKTRKILFADVVAMDTVRLGFRCLSAMNGLNFCAADIGNAYLYGLTKEKVFVRAGPKFGELEWQAPHHS